LPVFAAKYHTPYGFEGIQDWRLAGFCIAACLDRINRRTMCHE